MTKNNIPQAGVEAGASVECQTTPVYPMLVVDRGLDVFHRNAEMLIRHDLVMTAPEDVKVGCLLLQWATSMPCAQFQLPALS